VEMNAIFLQAGGGRAKWTAWGRVPRRENKRKGVNG